MFRSTHDHTTPRRRSRRGLRRAIAASAVAGVGVMAAVSPASAATATYDDPADASGGLADIRRVKVTNQGEWLTVRVTFEDLRPRALAGATVYVDNTGDSVPDAALITGLARGTDYAMVPTKGWKLRKKRLPNCDHDLRVNHRKDVMVAKVSRECLGYKETLAVAVKATDQSDGSHPITDWLGGRRFMTDQVPSL